MAIGHYKKKIQNSPVFGPLCSYITVSDFASICSISCIYFYPAYLLSVCWHSVYSYEVLKQSLISC